MDTMKKLLLVFGISMIPVVELRGAIPIGTAAGLDLWIVVLISVLGNLIPVPFVILFVQKVFAWLRTKSEGLNRLVCRLEARAEKRIDAVRRYEFWGLFLLVAIPLPGTGAWTGALVAAMMDMRLKDAFPAIALGVLAAGVIVMCVTYGVVAVV